MLCSFLGFPTLLQTTFPLHLLNLPCRPDQAVFESLLKPPCAPSVSYSPRAGFTSSLWALWDPFYHLARGSSQRASPCSSLQNPKRGRIGYTSTEGRDKIEFLRRKRSKTQPPTRSFPFQSDTRIPIETSQPFSHLVLPFFSSSRQSLQSSQP